MSYFRARNLLLVFALLVAVVLAATVTIRYQGEKAIKTVAEALPEGIDLALKDIDYTHVDEGVARWRLQADQVEHQSSTKLLLVRSPHLDFFDDEGQLKGTLIADQGQISNDYQQVQMAGNVVLESDSGYKFYTDILNFDQTTELVTTDAPIRLVGDGLQLTGRGMQMNVASRELTVEADVDARLDPKHFNQD